MAETPTVPDGPDSELAEAIANLRRGTEVRLAALEEGRVSIGTGRFLATIVRAVLARPAAGRDLTDVEDEILATLNSELKVPPRAAARIAQARADQAEGYGSTTSVVDGLLRELDRRGGELVRLRAAIARPAVARTDGLTPTEHPRERAIEPIKIRLESACYCENQPSAREIVDAIRAAELDIVAAPADDTAAPDTVTVPRVHLRSWVDFLRALVQQDAIRALNARDAVLDNARQIESWAGQPVRGSQPEATDG